MSENAIARPVFALTYGDAAGIGAELVAKALQSEEVRRLAKWVLIGDERIFQRGMEIAKASYEYTKISDPAEALQDDHLYMIAQEQLAPEEVPLGILSEKAGKACGDTLKLALQYAKEGKFDGVVYAPLNKEALHRGGLKFHDELHFFADQLGCKEGFSEINVMDKLWVTRVTSHIPLRKVSDLVTKERVKSIIRFAFDTLVAVGIEKPRIVVAALNPHAGDGGLLGHEEIEEIQPAVQEMKATGIDVEGPFPADTIFLRLQKNPFDCIVGMYHDQVQTGMKLLGFHKGVTISGGLPVVLTTPAHGTAFDIAAQGTADPGAMITAMNVAVRLAKGKLNSSVRPSV